MKSRTNQWPDPAGGPINTDHILFIASGAFHNVKPADMIAELQGRLPIRVELQPLPRAAHPGGGGTEETALEWAFEESIIFQVPK